MKNTHAVFCFQALQKAFKSRCMRAANCQLTMRPLPVELIRPGMMMFFLRSFLSDCLLHQEKDVVAILFSFQDFSFCLLIFNRRVLQLLRFFWSPPPSAVALCTVLFYRRFSYWMMFSLLRTWHTENYFLYLLVKSLEEFNLQQFYMCWLILVRCQYDHILVLLPPFCYR